MSEVSYRPVWLAADTADQVAAMKFWRDHDLVAGARDLSARAAQLCVLAMAGGEVIGVSTARIRPIEIMKRRFAIFRCAVAPDWRRQGVAAELAVRSRQVLEPWALANPDQDVQGMACLVIGEELKAKQTQPIWPRSGLALVGYDTSGNQLRVAWFATAMV